MDKPKLKKTEAAPAVYKQNLPITYIIQHLIGTWLIHKHIVRSNKINVWLFLTI
uniref:Uncharacterized protein n=1 Tax=Anguilla anguilla TaxID=7936 RepID=A0A0E9XFA0_ANGAN